MTGDGMAHMNGAILAKSRHGRSPGASVPAHGHRCRTVLSRGWTAIDRVLKALAEGVAEARRVARLYDELSAMSDPELQDMGISRGDILAVISGRYHRPRLAIPVRISSGRRERSLSPEPCHQPRDQRVSP